MSRWLLTAAFPNDGIRIAPRLIRKVTSADGITIMEDLPQVFEATKTKTARTMMVFLQEVIHCGNGRRGIFSQASVRGKGRHDQRLHRCVVPGIFSLNDVRRVGGL